MCAGRRRNAYMKPRDLAGDRRRRGARASGAAWDALQAVDPLRAAQLTPGVVSIAAAALNRPIVSCNPVDGEPCLRAWRYRLIQLSSSPADICLPANLPMSRCGQSKPLKRL